MTPHTELSRTDLPRTEPPGADPARVAPLPIGRGLACRCPRCGKTGMFNGYLTLKPCCESCGLDFAFADAGDGPAVFIILFAGFVVVGGALLVEIAYQPPLWLHAMVWLPVLLAVTLWPLRAMKGLLIALQYHHRAAEGRLAPPPDP